MDSMIFLIFVLAVVFAVSMGGSNFGAAFATAYGGKILNRKTAGFLFAIFAILGAVLCGDKVSVTLGKNIVSPLHMGAKTTAVILFSSALSMLVANFMSIPQSTSLVTVASIAGAGVGLGDINLETIYYLIPFWIGLPLLCFGLTYILTSLVYPPRKTNYWVYENFVNHESKLRKFVIVSCCYSAFSVGTNNVANVAGPLMNVTGISLINVLFFFACLFGTGAFIFIGPLKTAGNKIVPLGLLTASIISLISGSLMIIASFFGVPQSFVMLQLGAIFAVSCLKEGHELTFTSSSAKKILITWTINPIITFFLSFGLSVIFVR